MTSYTCPGCGEHFTLTKATDLTLIVAHAKICDAQPPSEVVDLPAL